MYGELTSGSTHRDPHWRDYVPKEAAVKTTDLDAFFDHGWNAHDVDALMTFMTNDCVLESASGPDAYGTRHEGREPVRAAFARISAPFPTFASSTCATWSPAPAAFRSGSSEAPAPTPCAEFGRGGEVDLSTGINAPVAASSAMAIGLTIPPSVLGRADQVIE